MVCCVFIPENRDLYFFAKIFLTILQIPIDKLGIVCYNTYTRDRN